ncbi:DUF305 domain-containing protein [Nocardia jejuensis]|uniref:DUF305 domain-containing protein n=1 Tax=Nocardia jejuensis TaxID=328049 RepID=UPI00082E0D53|nr:DUF305 domain-containing protein [Nocardia jejuensis]
MFTTPIKLAVVAATSAVALIAAGCGSDDSSSPATTSTTTVAEMPGMNHGASSQPTARSDFNDADVTFLQMMYPHHAQAVEMAKLVSSRSQNAELIALASSVEQAQSPEMAQITSLLQSFGKPAPNPTMGGHEGMPGMMTDERMSTLESLSGPDFDRLWMTMMIEHHRGAIGMANTELAAGTNPESKALAQAIVAAQQSEIDRMNRMLAQG